MSIIARVLSLALFSFVVAVGPNAAAQGKEASEVRIVKQLGLAALPLMVMENNKLLEKHLQKAGLTQSVSFIRLGNTMGINDALISGNVDFAPNGPPSLLTVWSRTKGTSNEIKGVINMNEVEFWLNVNRPEIKSVKDFTEQDRIAVTAVKVGVPAVLLQMVAAKEWGMENFSRLDKRTISMSHPDAVVALTSKSDLTGHFAAPPYTYQGAGKPGIHTILKSSEIVGPFAGSLVMATTKFYEANPRTVKAFVDAMTEAVDTINRDKRAAAQIYLTLSGDKVNSLEDTVKQLNDPALTYTTTPRNLMKFATFMNKAGSLSPAPATWQDLFFPPIHGLPGS